MPRYLLLRLALPAILVVSGTAASGQAVPPPPPRQSMQEDMSGHMMGPWKEMNAFHQVMSATWHPARSSALRLRLTTDVPFRSG